jgi:alcohol dehydrogenase (cytochrome c)
VWVPGVYDPASRLYIFGTGNPTPAYTGVARPGDNLFTCSLMAVNVDTGKMQWYFQTSAHDTHDWDSAQTPILIDGNINGQPRKLVSTASRNGYFYTLDRLTGEHIVTSRFGSSTNWAKHLRPSGVVEPDLAKAATVPGTLVSPIEGGVTNWPPSAFSPTTGFVYVQERNGFNLVYLSDPDPRGSMGLGGKVVAPVGAGPSALTAIDYRTGRVAWRHVYPGVVPLGGAGGVLATAGGLVFSGDAAGNFVAFDEQNGRPVWHSRIGTITNAPQTYLVEGHQHVLVAAGDMLYAFAIYE